MPAKTLDARADARRRGLAVFARMMRAAKARGLAAKDVAAAAGMSPHALSRWTTAAGGKGPSYGELERIAEALGSRLADFAADEAPPHAEAVEVADARMRQRLDRLLRANARFHRSISARLRRAIDEIPDEDEETENLENRD